MYKSLCNATCALRHANEFTRFNESCDLFSIFEPFFPFLFLRDQIFIIFFILLTNPSNIYIYKLYSSQLYHFISTFNSFNKILTKNSFGNKYSESNVIIKFEPITGNNYYLRGQKGMEEIAAVL